MKRKQRFLPQYVTGFQDRHGKTRLRFRKKGCDAHYFKADLGTEAFREEYRACLDNIALPAPSAGSERNIPGSFGDLISRYYASSKWTGKTEGARKHDRRIIEAFRAEHGHRPVAGLTYEKAELIIGKKGSTPTAANKLLKIMKRLIGYAIAIKLRPDDPFGQVARLTIPGSGYHEWTEDEIGQFQDRHPYGTKARLAMELMLWTGQRRSDARLIGRQHTRDGKIEIRMVQAKTKEPLRLPVAPQLVWAITAMPPHDHLTYLVTQHGAPYSVGGFGNIFRDWCDQAGLPQCSAHGLRKAMARRLANLGMGNQSIKSVGGWKTDSEVNRYTKGFDQASLAEAAIMALSDWDMSNQREKLDIKPQQEYVNKA